MIIDDAWAEVRKEAALLARMNAFPLWTTDQGWVTAELDQPSRGVLPHHGSWMVGDLPAILWFIAAHERDSTDYQNRHDLALEWSRKLESRSSLTAFASVSHLFYRGGLLPMTITGETVLEPMVHAAARTISRRFSGLGYMKSFGEPGDQSYPFTTVDDVINLVLPVWHAMKTADDQLRSEAIAAATLIGDRLVRADGSCGQVLHFDADAQPTKIDTYQGYSVEGCWSRGLAWAIYGFAAIYRATREPLFLELAEATADYWIDHVQDDPSPIWDFQLPSSEPQIRDSFAAGLGYAGLLELASLVGDARRQELVDYTRTMVEGLVADHVLGQRRGLGLVSGAALDVPHQHGVNCSVIVGDSYLVEAMWRLESLTSGQPH